MRSTTRFGTADNSLRSKVAFSDSTRMTSPEMTHPRIASGSSARFVHPAATPRRTPSVAGTSLVRPRRPPARSTCSSPSGSIRLGRPVRPRPDLPGRARRSSGAPAMAGHPHWCSSTVGGRLVGAQLRQHLVDEIVLDLPPQVVGGCGTPHPFDSAGPGYGESQ